MGFIAGAFLVGLPLVAVPVIVHLLNRRRRNVMRWGAMRFLTEAVTRRRRMWRIDDLLLMVLRALAVAAFVFALAQPMISSGLFGESGSRDVFLVLDTSMSTSREGPDGTAFRRQIDAARDLIGRLGEGDTVRVLLASTGPQWLTPVAVPVNEDSKRELMVRLENLKPTLAAADMLRCTLEAVEAESSGRATTRIVTILTDGRAYGWRTEAAEGWKRIRKAAAEAKQPTTLNVVDVWRQTDAAANLSIESVSASRVIAALGEGVSLTATVRNRGSVISEACLVSWSEGDQALGVSSLAGLAPGQSTTVSIEHAFGASGGREVTCRIECPDDLEMDNTGRLVVEVVREAPILIVTSGGGQGPLDDDTAYVLAALGYDPSGKPRSAQAIFRPRIVSPQALLTERLSDYYCVVLANVPAPSEASLASLVQYVRGGGGLWIVLGDRAEIESFNARCFVRGAGLSPLSLDGIAGDADDWDHGVAVLPPAVNHSATRLLGDTERLDIDRVRVRRRCRFLTTEADKGVSVLLATEGGFPLVVENRLGRGRVIVQGIPLGARWSNLPACHVFVAMLYEWLWYLSEPATPDRNIHPGDTLTVTVPTGRSVADATIATADGRTVPLRPVAGDAGTKVEFDGTLIPGGYHVTMDFADKTSLTVPFNVLRDAEESDLEPLKTEQSNLLAEAGGLRFDADGLAQVQTERSTPDARPVWWYLLVALLAMMLAELLLAWRATTRRMITTPGLSMKTR
ncbi:MAG: BatA domain-containing protein [Planctomycetes bacterium]|nr:BatA domain-containing protein [Planctomycetota bacterium]